MRNGQPADRVTGQGDGGRVDYWESSDVAVEDGLMLTGWWNGSDKEMGPTFVGGEQVMRGKVFLVEPYAEGFVMNQEISFSIRN